MIDQDWLASRFEENRPRLRMLAYRMLGSINEADDAVQETWLRLSRSGAQGIENLEGWLTTVAARVCLDMLRSRTARREEPLDPSLPEPAAGSDTRGDPEHEALLAASVSVALLVVLDRLTPAERIAFVLHDMFDVSFDEIAAIVGRSVTAARQLASRARRRVQGASAISATARPQQRQVVDRFLAALRAGDFDGLLAVLDPDVVARVDGGGGRPGAPREVRGAQTWAKGALAFTQAARFVHPALVDGRPGLILVRGLRLLRALCFEIAGDKIVQVDVVTDPARLRALDVAVFGD